MTPHFVATRALVNSRLRTKDIIVVGSCMEVIIYLGQFKAILNHFGVILGPFVDPLGTILGRFWGYLEPFWVHFGTLFGPIWG